MLTGHKQNLMAFPQGWGINGFTQHATDTFAIEPFDWKLNGLRKFNKITECPHKIKKDMSHINVFTSFMY